ncbi:MAG: hypothetical protein GY720_07025 [bacterium]|nr:hypothetical protein [bacterium]
MSSMLVKDKGWVPAFVGLITFRVWKPGRSSVIARLRAIWVLMNVVTIAAVGLAMIVGDAVVLRRLFVYAGWGAFALAALGALSFRSIARKAALRAEAERIPIALGGFWFNALASAVMPVLAASRLMVGEQAVSYPVYWGAAVSVALLALVAPTVGRVARLDEMRMAVDGASIIEAIHVPTKKIDRSRRR